MDFRIFFVIVPLVNCNFYVNFLKDYLDSQLIVPDVITEFSCDKKSSFELLKALFERGWQGRSLEASPSNVQYEYVLFNKHLFILRTRCGNFSRLLTVADQLKLFSGSYKWVLFHDDPQTSLGDLLNVLSPYNILVDSDFDVCDVSNESVRIRKVFKYHQSGTSLSVEDWTMWYPIKGLKGKKLDHNVFRRRSDLKGISLNTCIVIVNNDSLNHLTDKKNKHIDSIAKVNYVLVEHLADIVNVSLNYSIKSTWGYKNANGEWSGLMGELTRREADIGGTPLFFTIDRVDYIDYIAMTTPTRSKFIFREPKLSYVANVYTLPFNKAVWGSTILLVILTAMVLYISLRWENQIRSSINESGHITNPSIKDVILVSYGALCQQGSPSIPSSVSGRITTIIMFISLMFLYTSYSANIVALLQSSSNSIQTLEDLLKSRLDVGVDDNVFNRFYFPNATEPIRKALYQKKVAPMGKPDHFMKMEEGVRRMRQGLFAFHMETGPGYKLVSEIFQESEKCGLKEIPFLEVIDPWLGIQKNLTYNKLLKIGLRKIQESGLQSREVGLIYTKKPPCVAQGTSFISVGIVDCYPAAVVLAGGIILAVAVLIVEFLLHKRYFKRLKIKTMQRIQRE